MCDINSKKVYQRWTKSAIECYQNGCQCNKCILVPADFRNKCKMKLVVIELVKTLGKPIDKQINF